MADGSQNIRPLGGGGRQGSADIPLAGHPEGEAVRCAGVPLSLSGAGRQHLDGHVAVLCETVHWPAGRHGGDTERMLLDKRNEKEQTMGTDGYTARTCLERRKPMECGTGMDGAAVGTSACPGSWSGGGDGHIGYQDVRPIDSLGAKEAIDGS